MYKDKIGVLFFTLSFFLSNYSQLISQPCNPHCYMTVAGRYWQYTSQPAYYINNNMYTSNYPQISQADWEYAIRAGANEWNNSSGANFYFDFYFTVSNNYSTTSDGYSVFGWQYSTGGELGGTFYFENLGGIYEVDSYINQSSGFDWSLNPSSTELDVQSLTTHEFGHWLYLADEPDNSCIQNTMHLGQARGDISYRTIEQDDKFGIQSLYPVTVSNQTLNSDRSVFEKWDGNMNVSTTNWVHILAGVTVEILPTCTITIPAGSRLYIDDNATLIIDAGATCNFAGAEIIEGGPCAMFYDNAGCRFSLSTGCLYVRGTYKLAKTKIVKFTNAGFFVLDATGVMAIDSAATIQIDTTATNVKLRPGGVIKFGQNAKLVSYDTLIAKGTATKPSGFS